MIRAACTLLLLSAAPALGDVKTPADREALFDAIVEKTMAREAWSPIKNETYGVSYPEAFEPFRQQFIDAADDVALFYAITRLSNARHDRHLSVSPVEGGLDVPEVETAYAPIRLMADFSEAKPVFFVADFDAETDEIDNAERLSIGDRVLKINGQNTGNYVDTLRDYMRASSEMGFRMRAAMSLNERSDLLPPELYGDRFELTLKPKRGRAYTVSAPYKSEDAISYQGVGARTYPGFERVLDFTSFDFYRATDDRKVVLFDWYGFRDDIVEAMDATIEYADQEGLLGHNVIWDGSQSRGGGRGAYAIQRLQPKSFKTTFGNLRISDIVPLFIAERVATFEARQVMSDGSRETLDDGGWLIDWLTDDVAKGIEANQTYSNNVPFKLAHAPKYSDGVLHAADKHFTGKLVCWLGPRGGSHLDQFAAIVIDNDLCPVLGMQAGGYSNTWEWEETLTWPGGDEPVVRYMWNIGHTIRPNGQILEGNPAQVTDFIPLTADNYPTYYKILMDRSFEILADERH